jgi:HSP20 family protein
VPDSKRNPFDGVTDLFHELSRMRSLGLRGTEAPAVEPAERTHASAWVPTTDILARGDDLVIKVELPGVDPEDVDLRFTHGTLTVSGTRSSGEEEGEDTVYYVRERFCGEFRRVISLPEGTEPSQILAEFDDGLVEITVRNALVRDVSTRIVLSDRSSGATSRRIGEGSPSSSSGSG